jgi:multiple sugar transport system substrate-binding protein
MYSGAAEELTWEDNIYALPFRSDIWILYYNKAIFDAAGLDYPSNDMTWEEFDALARQLTSGSGADKIYGAHFHVWRSAVQLGTVQAGDPIINDDYSFMTPMYDMVTAMQDDGIIMDYGELRTGNIHYSGPFKNGQVAMLPMGSWFIGSLIQAQNDGEFEFGWGIAAYPHPEGVEAGTTAGTLTSLAINSNSTQQDAAWDFLQFYTGPEGAQILAESTLPAVRTPEVLEIFVQTEGVPEGAADALQTSTVRLELPMNPLVASVEQILNEEHELIMTRSNSVEEGIAEINRRIGELE